jgi:hypothetical protein
MYSYNLLLVKVIDDYIMVHYEAMKSCYFDSAVKVLMNNENCRSCISTQEVIN